MIISRTYNTIPGASAVSHPSLYGVRILGVKREGLGQTENGITPTNREFFYFGSVLNFDISIPFNSGEKIWVLYET